MKTQSVAIAFAIAAFTACPMLPSSALAQSAPPAGASAAKTEAPASGAATDAMSGLAAWYGQKFNGRKTASGQRFNAGAMTAAHPSLAYGTRVKVTNAKNNRSVVVVINDRGPTQQGRVIDVSHAAAKRLGFTRAGLTDVKLEVVGQRAASRGKHRR